MSCPTRDEATPSGKGRLRRFQTCQRGATAVEFGMIALPFFGLLFAIIEAALGFWATQVLETAVSNASRQIYTGQFQTDSDNKGLTNEKLREKFKTALCGNVTALFDCSKVDVDVKPVTTYGGAVSSPPVKDGKYDTTGYGYSAPGSNQITIVRASMEYSTVTGFLTGGGSTLANGNRLIVAAATFRTEPY